MPLYRIGKTWYIDVRTTRGRVRRSAKTANRQEAQAYYDRVKREVWRQEQLGEAPRVTWGQAVAKWVEARNPGLPDRYRIRAISVHSDDLMPLTPDSLKGSQHLAPASWNRIAMLVALIHRLSGVQPPSFDRRKEPKGRIRWLSAEEWSSLSKALATESPLLYQCARFALATGLRENNVLELEWSQVDLRGKRVFFHADQMKGRTSHGIPLTDAAVAVLEERRGQNKRWVFAHPDSGKPLYKASNKAWYKALKKAKLYKTGVNWHSLRHTFASWAVMSGVPLLELQQLGGWKSLHMVQRYAHLSPDHLAESAAKIRPISLKSPAKRQQIDTMGG